MIGDGALLSIHVLADRYSVDAVGVRGILSP